MKNLNIKTNFLVYSGALVLMTCTLAACGNSSTSNARTNGAYSNGTSDNVDATTNIQSNSS